MLTPVPEYRATKSDATRFKLMLRVRYRANTTCLWKILEPHQIRDGTQFEPSTLPIPEWLVDRFTSWHAACVDIERFDYDREHHDKMRLAYELSLAIDLSFFLEDEGYYIECQDIEIGWPRFTYPANSRVPFSEFWTRRPNEEEA